MPGLTSNHSFPIYDSRGADKDAVAGECFDALVGPSGGMTIKLDAILAAIEDEKASIRAKSNVGWLADTTTIMKAGEIGLNTTSGIIRIGDGVNIWSGLDDYLPAIPILSGNSAPNYNTVGKIGQFYLHTDTDRQRLYICRNINHPSYYWEGVAYLRDLSEAGFGDMLKIVYDADDDGIVDNASKLGGNLPSYYISVAEGDTVARTAASIADGKAVAAQNSANNAQSTANIANGKADTNATDISNLQSSMPVLMIQATDDWTAVTLPAGAWGGVY